VPAILAAQCRRKDLSRQRVEPRALIGWRRGRNRHLRAISAALGRSERIVFQPVNADADVGPSRAEQYQIVERPNIVFSRGICVDDQRGSRIDALQREGVGSSTQTLYVPVSATLWASRSPSCTSMPCAAKAR